MQASMVTRLLNIQLLVVKASLKVPKMVVYSKKPLIRLIKQEAHLETLVNPCTKAYRISQVIKATTLWFKMQVFRGLMICRITQT
jgi:hypothetical protein